MLISSSGLAGLGGASASSGDSQSGNDDISGVLALTPVNQSSRIVSKFVVVNCYFRVSIALIHSTCQAGSSKGTGSLGCRALSAAAGLTVSQLPSAWPVASLNLAVLTTKYWQSEQRSCCRCPLLPLSLQRKFNLNLLRKFKFKFTGMLIPITSSFNVLSQSLKLKF